MQTWAFVGQTMRQRLLCDLPPPDVAGGEEELREREAMGINPFPDLFDRDNKADTFDSNLLEKEIDDTEKGE